MDLFGFALAVLLIELTPGPNMGWLVALVLSEGRRSGIAAIAGIGLGLACNATISMLAASLFLQQAPFIDKGLALCAAVMMAYLAWHAWKGTGESSPSAVPRRALHRNAFAGFLINLFNAKAALFFITVMPQFVPDARPSYSQALTLAALSVAIATAIHLGLVLGAERVRTLVLGDHRTTWLRRIFALGMIAIGVWFIGKAFL